MSTTPRHSTSTEPRSTGRRAMAAFAAGAALVAAIGGGVLIATQSDATPAPAASSSTSVPATGGGYTPSNGTTGDVPTGHTTPATPATPSKPVTPVKPATPAADPALAGAQQELAKLGYYNGPNNGQMTSATSSAITAFQTWAKGQSFGGSVTVNGHFDPPTQYALNCALGGNANGPGTGN